MLNDMMKKHPARIVTQAAFAVTALFGFASCAGSESSSDSTSSSDDVIRIGLEAPLTGDQQEVGIGMLNGALLAADEINAAGGVNGKTVTIVPIDDAADPDTGVAVATAAISSGLDAVVGPYNSGVGAETLPLYLDAGIFPMRLTSADSTQGLGFTLQPMTSQIAPVATSAITDWAKAQKVALIFDQTTTYTKDANTAMRTLLEAAGVNVTVDIGIDPGADDYTDVVDEALATNPDLVYVITYYREGGLIAKAMLATNTSARCLADFGAYDTGFVTTAGVTAARNCSVVGVPAPDDFPNSESLVAAYKAKFDVAPGTWSPYTYDSVKMLADAIASVGSSDVNAIRAFLLEQQNWSGWTGTVGFDEETGNRVPAPVVVVSTREDGTLHLDQSWASTTQDSMASGVQLRAEMSLSSDFSVLQKVGPDETQTYGWNRLVGITTSNLGEFDVVMLGNVNYEEGNGPFFGFLTLTSLNGDVLSMQMNGSARVADDGVTRLSSELRVIGGTGKYVNVGGSGRFTGERIADVGAPIEFTLMVDITGM
jgi:branched-chain amino acid transport system substrate-binding protein